MRLSYRVKAMGVLFILFFSFPIFALQGFKTGNAIYFYLSFAIIVFLSLLPFVFTCEKCGTSIFRRSTGFGAYKIPWYFFVPVRRCSRCGSEVDEF